MKTLVVIQARMGSNRLPGKVLRPLAGAPLLERMLERLQAATLPSEIAVATSFDPKDEPIRDLCRRLGVPCVSGHPTDLLDRHVQASRAFGADLVAKIPSDCPLIDPGVVDRVIAAFLDRPEELDYVSNLHPASWPDGNDVEIVPADVLESAWAEAERPFEREHTTPFVWERPDRFRLGNVVWETGLDLSMTHRFTIDYPDDYNFVSAVYDALWTRERPVFGLAEILDLLATRPALFALNSRYAGVNWYHHHLSELRTVGPHQTRSPHSPEATS